MDKIVKYTDYEVNEGIRDKMTPLWSLHEERTAIKILTKLI